MTDKRARRTFSEEQKKQLVELFNTVNPEANPSESRSDCSS